MELLHRIETKWQRAWDKAKVFEANPDPSRKKCFVTFPYSYANGPLHVGHAFTATRTDAYARFKRMQGYNVLFPWAWHWTGQTIAGASARIKLGDEEFVKALREIDKVPEKELRKLGDPKYMASYYTRENRKTVKQAGFSIDWRREFHTASPTFSKFIEWQYMTLRRKGYVVKGTHPVVWCPQCRSPTGDHDRHEGEGIAPEEFTLIKFKHNDAYLLAATFRPETIYGVTNVWINPEADYVRAKVDGEEWIISKRAAEKLSEQKRKIQVISQFKGEKLIGHNVANPLGNTPLPILPASFVDPQQATGVVYSVPAHAPVDWLALEDLKQAPDILRKFGIAAETVRNIKPISIIQTEGFGENPAKEVVDQLGVKDQCDPKAEDATKILYKKEFHNGVLKENCDKHSGKTVRAIKEPLVKEFKTKKIAETMYDLLQPVICRCLTPCIVKVLEEQWFLKYSDPEWKNATKSALHNASIFPETAISWFQSTIDWLRDWPCARKSGLGTPLPWNNEWIIETLSDSTIYMAFYTINKDIRKHSIPAEKLKPEVFDYVLYGKGDLKTVARQSAIETEVLRSMRKEFLYWYPVDMRNSAKELIPNHLTFFLFHHVALFPREHWPRIIDTNGMLKIEGQKMSKSKGNFVTLRSAIERYGTDSTRCALLMTAEEMDDPDWREENIRDIRDKLESFIRLAETITEKARKARRGLLEDWLISMLQNRIKIVTENMENFKTHTAVGNALFEVWNDFRWYIRRKGHMEAKALLDALDIWVRLLTPFTPHICEELWEKMNRKEIVSSSEWPKYDQRKVNPVAEESESLVRSVVEDTLSIVRATKTAPQKIFYYTSTSWKRDVYQRVLMSSIDNEQVDQKKLTRDMIEDHKTKASPQEIAKFTSKIVGEINRIPQVRKRRLLLVQKLDEYSVLTESKAFLQRELGAEIHVYLETDETKHDPNRRAVRAEPFKPAIYIE
jgi:leucyl-tRNA synthetase